MEPPPGMFYANLQSNHDLDCVFLSPDGFLYVQGFARRDNVVQHILEGVGPLPRLGWVADPGAARPITGISQPFVGALLVRGIAEVQGIDAAIYVIVLEGPQTRRVVHSSESEEHVYGAAVLAISQAEPGQYNEIHMFTKMRGSHNVRGTRRALPLGPGAFMELTTSGPVSPFILSITNLAHAGATHTRIVITNPFALHGEAMALALQAMAGAP